MSTTTRRNRLSTIESVSWGRTSELSYANLSKLTSSTACYNGEFEENEIVEEEDTNYKLPHFKACLFATVLEEVIPQLRILDACNTQLRLNKTMSEMVVLLADKYGVERNLTGEALDEVNPKNLNCMKYNLDKLQSDRDFISQVMSETYQNLCIERDFQPLTDSVNEIVRKRELLHQLVEEENSNKMLRREAHRQLRQLRNHIKSVTYDSNSEIQALRSQVEDVELNAWSRERYVEGWQRARTEQHLQTLYNKERVPSKAIAEFKRKVEEEQRVHAEIELLTTININEVLGKVEKWIAKYETDMERIDLRIQIMKNDYENILDKNQRLDETIKDHEESMNNWVAFKDEREAARKHREKMTNSAIIIQAWWRGLLVRNQLGPYKPAKKKGGASGETSKKKKLKINHFLHILLVYFFYCSIFSTVPTRQTSWVHNLDCAQENFRSYVPGAAGVFTMR